MAVGAQRDVVAALAERIEQMGQAGRQAGDRLRTGWQGLDHFWPGGGLRVGTTVEWLGEEGSGVWSLALLSAARAMAGRGGIVIFDRRGELYPPGLPSVFWGGALSVVIRSSSAKEELWAWEQVLRSRGVALAIGRIEGVSDPSLRRLARAAEQGQTLGVWVRPMLARGSPCWSEIRLAFQSIMLPRGDRYRAFPSVRQGRLTLLRARQGHPGRQIEVQWNEQADSLSVVSSLGYSAPASSQASWA
jgi:protein ImuA